MGAHLSPQKHGCHKLAPEGFSESACGRKGKEQKQDEVEEATHSQTQSISSDNQSLPAVQELAETDPILLQALWSEVMSTRVANDSSRTSFGIVVLAAEEYHLPDYSSIAFVEVLEQFQVTIKEHKGADLRHFSASFWSEVREATTAASIEAISDLESSRIWMDIYEGTEPAAKTVTLAAKMAALVADRDSGPMDRQQFVISHILGIYDLPGVRLFNNLAMLDVDTEPYHLLSAGKSSIRSLSTPSLPTTVPRSTSSVSKPSNTVPRRNTPPAVAQPPKIESNRDTYLALPTDINDCAYWLEALDFRPLGVVRMAHETFVSSRTTRKTSPYLTIAFDNLGYGNFAERRMVAKHKIAVYGSTALYNRHLLSAKAFRNGKNESAQAHRCLSILHFGLVFVGSQANLHVFQGAQSSGQTEWRGCNMWKIGEWDLTDPEDLTHMISHLRVIADWVKRVYMPGLQDDPAGLCQTFRF